MILILIFKGGKLIHREEMPYKLESNKDYLIRSIVSQMRISYGFLSNSDILSEIWYCEYFFEHIYVYNCKGDEIQIIYI